MPRYLTPSKLCLLVFLDFYLNSSGDLPPGDASTLSILSFLASHINCLASPADDSDIHVIERKLQLSLEDFAEELSKWNSSMPGRSLWDVFLQRLWGPEVGNDLDALFKFFERLQTLITPPESNDNNNQETNDEATAAASSKVSRASPFGQFIRRSCVEFTRLQFHDCKVSQTDG